jgi:pyrimidine nucleoside transport protein
LIFILIRTEANALDAAAQGASNAVFLVANIIANLITFLAFIAFLNGVISWFANLLGAPYVTFEV